MLKNAAEIPVTMFSWLKETIWPRMCAGEISAMYIGATMSEAPTPSPPIIRAATSAWKLGARADAMAEIAYRTAA